MTATFEKENINSDMSGYFINGNLSELYVVGIDEEHFYGICKENGLDDAVYDGNSNHAILINNATGEYGTSSNRVVVGAPFVMGNGYPIELKYGSEANRTVDDTYIDLAINTAQHEKVTNCLADMGFF